MRDINRISDFCNKLAEEWKKVPDMRFGQLMLNIFNALDESSDVPDTFYIEDDKMIKYIQAWVRFIKIGDEDDAN